MSLMSAGGQAILALTARAHLEVFMIYRFADEG